MVATSDISQGDTIFEIPRSLLLTPQNSTIGVLLNEEADSLQEASRWVPLLITLMYEYTSPSSRWKPYFDLVPDFDQLDLPMFWSSDEVKRELKGTGIPSLVESDLLNISKEFNDLVLPFIQKHSNVFSDECKCLKFYKKMVAFVMAYSFTEPPPSPDLDDSDDLSGDEHDLMPQPMMVPMADILNHVAKNSARLDFPKGSSSLKMVATQDIQKGEEIFNTYGELANMNLLHMYGFAEDIGCNEYDIAEIPVEKLLQAVIQKSPENQEELEKRWQYLQIRGHAEELGESLIVEMQGILNDQVLALILKVLHLPSEEFALLSKKTDDGWDEDPMESDSYPQFTFENIPQLPEDWKQILKCIAEEKIEDYSHSLKDEEVSRSTDAWHSLSQRQKFCSHVRFGQLRLLHSLVQACQS
ncbi:hypothetical protein CAPTEDRAFT_151537 [Capitella teleta]|uniref:SET domain-containing protein n=1 Tax=Capitella teleta TaxID=283909 RepID=R7U508_CAPTE|nr:hypothetical protein CAPTEDRAFT_151537 [Capitella teleta]|eukprot:ELT98776.1 hypothetical protein CAPTEDRAFT_151537 [Capitella teleta]